MRAGPLRTVALCLVAFAATCCGSAPADQPGAVQRPVVRLLHTWAIEPSTTRQLEAALTSALPHLQVDLRRPDGRAETALLMLQRGDADAVFTFSTFAYMAQTTRRPAVVTAADFRAIAELPARPVQVLIGPHSRITSIGALRGRRVSIGPLGSNAALMAEILLQAFGISMPEVQAEQLDLQEATRRLLDGRLDALFANVYGNDDIANAIRGGARMLTIDGAEVDRVRASYPLLKPTIIPRGTYTAEFPSTHTIGIDEILLCRTDLDESLAHALTRALVDVVSRRDLDFEPLRSMNLGTASSTIVPLHPGAARYYRERELLP